VLHLIHAYREHPCLWDPSDKNYEDELARNIAYEAIMVRMDNRANVLFTLEELKKTIEQLHIQYALALETKEKGKLVGLAARYFAKCDYLSVSPIVTPKENEEDEDLTVIKVISTQLAFVSFLNNPFALQLNFKEENLITSSFIETYANYPGLYNSALSDFTSVEARANAYRRMAKEFQPVVKANETDVYIAVNKLRRWLYNAMRRLKSKELIQKCTPQEVQYLRMCSFLPAKGSESQVLYCDYCEKRFHGDYNLRVHIFKAHQVGDLPYLCSLCPRRFDRQVDMDRHKLRSHFERKLRRDGVLCYFGPTAAHPHAYGPQTIHLRALRQGIPAQVPNDAPCYGHSQKAQGLQVHHVPQGLCEKGAPYGPHQGPFEHPRQNLRRVRQGFHQRPFPDTPSADPFGGEEVRLQSLRRQILAVCGSQ